MRTDNEPDLLPFGSDDLRLPDELRAPLRAHLAALRERSIERGWAGRMGFVQRPALIVIDLAKWWVDSTNHRQGSHIDAVVRSACTLLRAARAAKIPIFLTTWDYDPSTPPSPHDAKVRMDLKPGDEKSFELDPRLGRQPGERLITKRYASAFKGTNLDVNLTSLGVDTLIVAGVSTSHCVYATCRDATDSFRVIVPREAIGERCEIMHEVNLLDIEIHLTLASEPEHLRNELSSYVDTGFQRVAIRDFRPTSRTVAALVRSHGRSRHHRSESYPHEHRRFRYL